MDGPQSPYVRGEAERKILSEDSPYRRLADVERQVSRADPDSIDRRNGFSIEIIVCQLLKRQVAG